MPHLARKGDKAEKATELGHVVDDHNRFNHVAELLEVLQKFLVANCGGREGEESSVSSRNKLTPKGGPGWETHRRRAGLPRTVCTDRARRAACAGGAPAPLKSASGGGVVSAHPGGTPRSPGRPVQPQPHQLGAWPDGRAELPAAQPSALLGAQPCRWEGRGPPPTPRQTRGRRR